MYPEGFQTHVEPGLLADSLEGSSRPGHFRGVATVVAKLFGAIQPDVVVFGQKDFQQLTIVRRMVTDLDMGIEIVGVATVRESDDLAISSRNSRLSTDDRQAAVCLVQGLRLAAASAKAGERDAVRLAATATERIAAEPRAELDYVEIVDSVTLGPLTVVDRPATIVAAAWFGDVRLIDNLPLEIP